MLTGVDEVAGSNPSGKRKWGAKALCSWGHNANSIRLWRVVLLRSDIRLTPSDIRYASFGGE